MFSTFVGGSILASLASFRRMLVSQEEYLEEGVNVVMRRFF